MKNMVKISIVSLTICVLVGCGEERPVAKEAADQQRSYEELADGDVLVEVNGKTLTKGDLEAEVALQKAVALTANPKMKTDRLEVNLRKMRATAQKRFVERIALLSEADRRGIVASDESLKAVRKAFLSKVFKFKKQKFDDLGQKMAPKFFSGLTAMLDTDAKIEELRKVLCEETKYTATAAEADKRVGEMRAYNERMAKLEAKIYRNATNVWNRVQAGESMEKAVARIIKSKDEHVEADMDWGTFELSFFDEYPQVVKFLSVMPAGTVSPPVEGDNGLMIFKVLDIQQPSESNGHIRYHLARIFFALPEFFPDLEGEELRLRISKDKSARALQERIESLVKAAKVGYPNGTAQKIFARPSKAANAPTSQTQKGK